MQIIECPRDAMQSLQTFIPTVKKIQYINALLKIGFKAIDFGSFVSSRAIPQLKDTAEVVKKIDLSETNTRLLAIVGNERGGRTAAQYDKISYIGYPFSISETFLRLNINSNFEKSLNTAAKLINICQKHDKQLVVYLSMAFGNHYGENWNVDIVMHWLNELRKIGVEMVSLSDTVGVATPSIITDVFKNVVSEFAYMEFGFHLHTVPHDWYDKIDAAYRNGCRNFDGVINGLGGCPMSEHELVGNVKTGNILEYARKNNLNCPIDMDAYHYAQQLAAFTFPAT